MNDIHYPEVNGSPLAVFRLFSTLAFRLVVGDIYGMGWVSLEDMFSGYLISNECIKNVFQSQHRRVDWISLNEHLLCDFLFVVVM